VPDCLVRSTNKDRAMIVAVAWKRLSRRSELMSKALGAKLWFFPDRLPYLRGAVCTFLRIMDCKPEILLIQLPQGPLLIESLLLRRTIKCKVVADVHTGFIVNDDWKSLLLNEPFCRFLKYADLVLVHNQLVLDLLPEGLRGKAMVVYDPWFMIEKGAFAKEPEEPYLVFPASFAPDEPLEELISGVIRNCPGTKIYITGNWRRQPRLKRYESDRVIFTGYLPTVQYEELLVGARAVVAGTKREYTSLMAAWEAVAYEKPLALSESATLRETFGDYPVYYNWRDEKSIGDAIMKVIVQKPNLDLRQMLRHQAVLGLQNLLRRLGSGGYH
jgi:hypothetical protein